MRMMAFRFFLLLWVAVVAASAATSAFLTVRTEPPPRRRRQVARTQTIIYASSRPEQNQEADNTPRLQGEQEQQAVRSQHHRVPRNPLKIRRKRTLPRRDLLATATAAATALVGATSTPPQITEAALIPDSAATSSSSGGGGIYTPQAIRPTVYRVDSTIPPTLLAVPNARGQMRVLQNLGRGLGTDKEAIVVDTVNLNNMLNKAVFGTADAIGNLVSSVTDPSSSSASAAASSSFVCLGMQDSSPNDQKLALSLTQSILDQARKSNKEVGIGISAFPISTQGALLEYCEKKKGRISTFSDLKQELQRNGVSEGSVQSYRDLLEYAASNQIPVIAAGILESDRTNVLNNGLQALNPEARERYVVDTEGFIQTTSDPRFKMYADRSLLKEYSEIADGSGGSTSNTGNLFAERILTHEAGATAVSRFAAATSSASKPVVMVVLAEPQNVRYLLGMNGRVPRVYNTLVASKDASSSSSSISDKDVTTILLNPRAESTLSKTRRLRLEIGTGPETLEYQTKVADYLWFSESPPVALLPRVMDY